ncbi:MAG TPA: helix-turn-helix domain-containing protein [Gammaproteobacteria bacterium]|nr:helix-turn-helix domain-containing protein [Gammaproteobacteria bacterium]
MVLADEEWAGEALVDQLLPAEGPATPTGEGDWPVWASLEEVERRHILQVLDRVAGHRERAAEILGINKTTLWRKLKQYRPGEEAPPEG